MKKKNLLRKGMSLGIICLLLSLSITTLFSEEIQADVPNQPPNENDRYLIITADKFYNNQKLGTFKTWRQNEFEVLLVNLTTILNQYPVSPIPDLLEIQALTSMSTSISYYRAPYLQINAYWTDENGVNHRFGYCWFNDNVHPPQLEFIQEESATTLQKIFFVIDNCAVHTGDVLTLTYDSGSTQIILLPKMREEYTYLTKLYITSDGNPFLEKGEQDSILNYIQNVFTTTSGKLKYVLLVGDMNLIPAFTYWNYNNYYEYVTDHLFSCIDGDDYAPDVAVGRFPANDAPELEVMIIKTMNGAITLKKFLMMNGFNDGEPGDSEYTYTRDVIINSLQYWVENPVITELQKKDGNLNKENAIDAINSGQDFIIYNGHGGQTCWYNFLYNSDMISLNEERPSIAFAFACHSGNYGASSDCFGEAFLKDDDSGVIGYYGSSSGCYVGPTNMLEDKLFQVMPNSSTIGEAILRSKVEYAQTYPLSHIAKFNLLGDPAVAFITYTLPPDDPCTPSGETNGHAGQEYTYTTSTIDPNGDDVYYLWDWGDGNKSGWIGPEPSEGQVSMSYTWTEKGSYTIRVKAKDIHGARSEWSALNVSMPYDDQSCFLAGTQITMTDGSYKNIENVKVGDLVKSYDIASGKFISRKVTNVYHHDTKDDLTDQYLIINGNLRVTPNHPVLVNGKWIEAGKVKIGDSLMKIDQRGCSDIPVQSVKTVSQLVSTYNIGVALCHSYVANGVVVSDKFVYTSAVGSEL